jgi:hypothetical protein
VFADEIHASRRASDHLRISTETSLKDYPEIIDGRHVDFGLRIESAIRNPQLLKVDLMGCDNLDFIVAPEEFQNFFVLKHAMGRGGNQVGQQDYSAPHPHRAAGRRSDTRWCRETGEQDSIHSPLLQEPRKFRIAECVVFALQENSLGAGFQHGLDRVKIRPWGSF